MFEQEWRDRLRDLDQAQTTSPRVSVVITCYNYEKYVAQAVQSALDQTCSPFEIVVVNDGSTDGSSDVLARFGDRIRYIEQKNRGQIGATNIGFSMSRGDVILFLDADDVLLSGALEAVVANWTPACAKVQFELEVVNGEGELLNRRFCNYVAGYDADQVKAEFSRFGTYVWPVLSGNAYSRWFLEELFPLNVAMGPDGYLNTLAPLYGDIKVVPKPLALYRLHDANQSYHGTNVGQIGKRFARQVSLRASELRALSAHSAIRGVALPAGNLLDHDLPFVNYRLMLKRLGQTYERHSDDSPVGLWWSGLVLLSHRPLPLRLKLSHAAWMSVLVCSPRWLSTRLIAFRFNRAELLKPFRRWRARFANAFRTQRSTSREGTL